MERPARAEARAKAQLGVVSKFHWSGEHVMAWSYATLRKKSDEDLIAEYDRVAWGTQIGLNFIGNELARRESLRMQEHMIGLTRQMRNLTIVIGVLTLVNVCAVIIAIVIK
ncbi:MAG: hypothetical protein NTW86_24720 [Candidatus Sumerlaeota bacterium]|nr:hypothetical protein [Candidatus Sumerlaeota bacterium]